MKSRELSCTRTVHELPVDIGGSGVVVVPSQRKSRLAQVHYFLDLSRRTTTRIEIDLESCISLIRQMDDGGLPFGFPDIRTWQQFCIGPHCVTPLARSGPNFRVAQRAFPRFIDVDTEAGRATLTDPGVGDDFLTAMSYWTAEAEEQWFGSWSIADTNRRLHQPHAPVATRLWRALAGSDAPKQIWSGEFGDFLHQVATSPDGRFAVLTQMGMRPAAVAPPGHPGSHLQQWQEFQRQGVHSTDVLVLDLERGSEQRIRPPNAVPAHIEFDPLCANRCYLACHNVALVGPANVLMGPASILAYELSDDEPKLVGRYSSDDFHRAASLAAFQHRGEVLLAVTGFPHRLHLINGRDMTPRTSIPLFGQDDAPTGQQPVFCRFDRRSPFGVVPSHDGELLYVAASGLLYVLDIAPDRVLDPVDFAGEPEDETITGHLSLLAL